MEEECVFLGDYFENLAIEIENVCGSDAARELENELKKSRSIHIKMLTIANFVLKRYKSDIIDANKAINTIRAINGQCPSDRKRFFKWVPQQLQADQEAIEEIREGSVELSNQVKRLRAEINEVKTPIPGKSSSSKLVRQLGEAKERETELLCQIKELEVQQQQIKAENKSLKKQSIKYETRIAELEQQLAESETEKRELSSELDKLKEKFDNSEKEIDVLNQVMQMKSKSSRPLSDCSSMSIDENQLEEENQKLKSELEMVQNDCLSLKSQCDDNEKLVIRLKDLKSRLREKQNEIALAEKKIEKLAHDNRILIEKIKKMKQSELEKDPGCEESMINKIKLLQAQKLELQGKLENSAEMVANLKAILLRKEAELAKVASMKSSLKVLVEKELAKIGFKLADALCQNFNPQFVVTEIDRLINVARKEHIELSESARVKLNPYGTAVAKEMGNSQASSVLFSDFDDLELQISQLQSKY